MDSDRAGRFSRQLSGNLSYEAFVPKRLPPEPPLNWDGELLKRHADASVALGRLDGMAATLANPDLFVASYVRREAVLSSQIEGTQSSLDDILAHEAEARTGCQPDDLKETVNHVKAMYLGLGLLQELPLSGRLIREVHGALMEGVRGQERDPGEFRKSQNWIGPAGCTLETATFVPPAPIDLPDAIRDFESYLNDAEQPPLVLAGLAHAQFETIHPFLDGNGRVGRLLITLLLVERRVLARPLLYLSLYLKQNRSEYYDRLDAIRTRGDWEGWLKFFLTGVRITADDAVRVARELLLLTDQHRDLAARLNLGRYAWPLLDLLAEQPVVTIRYSSARLGATTTSVGRLLERMAEQGIVDEITGRKRDRLYRYSPFLDVLTEESPQPVDSTQARNPGNPAT